MKLLIFFTLALASSMAEPLPRNAMARITNGVTAAIGNFPYQVGLILKLNSTHLDWCGGSLIGKEWVLTAAHCVDLGQSATVILGAVDRTKPELRIDVPSKNIIVHPNYNTKTLINDIALIKIPAVTYSARIQSVRLPPLNSNMTYAGYFANASGWGKTSDTATMATMYLQWATMQVITNSECSKFFVSSIQPSNICVATRLGISPCIGDSGGPLVLESPIRTQIGVFSFVGSACTKGFPAAFARVTSYLAWIKSHTGIYY